MSSLIRRRVFASLATISLVAPVPALAGPNDNLTVRTKVHVDSPNAFWDKKENNFILKSKSGDVLPIEETVNWVSKGAKDLGEYVYRVPNDERLKFLGEPGTRLYGAGNPAGGKGTPIWAGFGADINLPTEKFRDGAFNMEIVDFKGPGKMELFRGTGDPTDPVERFWSSHEKGLRATWVDRGNHTHNQTTYTKPGQYEVTYRASARTTDGTLIESKPQKLVWQVGGTEPRKDGLGDVKKAFDAAADYGEESKGTFTIEPYKGDKFTASKDMTRLSLDTGNKEDSGHAVFYIDGFYLAEVPVTNGKAEWIEMIGDEESDFQAVYIPNEDAKSKPWISAPITFKTDDQVQTTTRSEDEFPRSLEQDEAPDFDAEEKTPTGNTVKVSSTLNDFIANEDEDDESSTFKAADLTVQPEDDSLVVQVKGGYYEVESGEDINDVMSSQEPTCMTNFISFPGNRTTRHSIDDCEGEENYVLALDIIPTSRTIAGGKARFVAELKDGIANTEGGIAEFKKADLGPEKAFSTSQDVENAGKTPDAEESERAGLGGTNDGSLVGSLPELTDPKDAGTGRPQAESADEDLTVIDITHGHVDIAPREDGNELTLRLKDESGIAAREATWREPKNVRFIVKEDRLVALKNDTGLLGNEGGKVYILPEDGRFMSKHPWPGLSTEELFAKTGKNYTFDFKTKSKPKNGAWMAFTGGNKVNPLKVIADSSKPASFKAEGSTHKHMSWGFTEPGIYEIEVTVTEDGGKKTKPEVLTFVVGDAAKSKKNQNEKNGAAAKKPLFAKPASPSQETSDNEKGSLRRIETGHLDFGPAFVNDKLGFYIGDESGRTTDNTDAGGHHVHDPSKVVLVVGPNRKRTLGKDVELTEDTEFIGKQGDTFYHLPLSEDHSAIWPGFDTNKIAHAFPKGMDIEIKPESQPEGAQWYAHRFSNLGTAAERIADSTGPARIHNDGPFHSHLDWIFTKAGTYKIQMRAVNDKDATDWTTITFDVDSNNATEGSVDKPLKAATPLSGAPVSKASGSASKKKADSTNKKNEKDKKKADKSKSGLLANTGLSAAEWLMALAMLFIGAGFWILGMKRMRD